MIKAYCNACALWCPRWQLSQLRPYKLSDGARTCNLECAELHAKKTGQIARHVREVFGPGHNVHEVTLTRNPGHRGYVPISEKVPLPVAAE